jgi:hypothetical protein
MPRLDKVVPFVPFIKLEGEGMKGNPRRTPVMRAASGAMFAPTTDR